MTKQKSKKQLKKKLLNWLLYWGVVGVSFVVLFYLVTSTWIGVVVRDRCDTSRARYEEGYRTGQAWRASEAESGEEWRDACTRALIEAMGDERNSYAERNDAVWALGQLGDGQALEALRQYRVGEIPEREPYNQTLSQYELEKAITLVEGGFNVTAWLWR